MLEGKVVEMLEKLAQQLGVASAKIWEWSLLQVKVEIIQNIVFFLLSVGLTFAVSKYALWIKKNWDDLYRKDLEPIHIVAVIVLGIFVTIMDIGAIMGMLDLPQLIINPEYAAFKSIVEQLGKLK